MKRRIDVHIDRLVLDDAASRLAADDPPRRLEAELCSGLADRFARGLPAGFMRGSGSLSSSVSQPGGRGLATALASAKPKGHKP